MNSTGFLIVLLVALTKVVNLAAANPVRRSNLDHVVPISQTGWVVPLGDGKLCNSSAYTSDSNEPVGSSMLEAPEHRTFKALAVGRGSIIYTCAQPDIALVSDARSNSVLSAVPGSDDGSDFVPDANTRFVPSRRATDSTLLPSFVPDAVPSSDKDDFVPDRRNAESTFVPDELSSSDDKSFVPSRHDAESTFVPDAVPSSDSDLSAPGTGSKSVPSRARNVISSSLPKFVSASAELYDVAPLLQFMPQLEDLHKFTEAFAKYYHGTLPNSTLHCIGYMNAATDEKYHYNITVDDAELRIDAGLYKNVSAPSPGKNYNWNQAFEADGGHEVYMVKTAGGSAPTTCEEQASDIVVTFAAEFWFYT